jgi:WD40 repeat protein
VAFSPDGSMFATGDFQGYIRLWDFTSAEPLEQLTRRNGTPGQVWQLRFSPDGEYLIAAGASGVTVWKVHKNSSSGVSFSRYRYLAAAGDNPGAIDLAIRPNSSEVVFLTWSGQVYTFDLNDVNKPSQLVLEKASGKVRSLHFNAQGNHLAFLTSMGTFGLMDWQSKKVSDTGVRAQSIAITHDGRYAALGDAQSQVTILELASGSQVLTLPSEGSEIWCLAWSKDANRLAVSLADGGVRMWNLNEVRARLADFGLDLTSSSKQQMILWQRLIRGELVHQADEGRQPVMINLRSFMSP